MEALLAQLHTLDNHSALYILHSMTPLAQFEERKILDLLQQLPKTPVTGQRLHHPLSSCFSMRVLNEFWFIAKRVMYISFPAEDVEAVSNLSSGVQRNIVLFQGFCAMKYAIYALCVNAHKYSNCTECESMQPQQHHQLSEAETDQNQTSTSSEGTEAVSIFCGEV